MTTLNATGSFEEFIENHKAEINRVQVMLNTEMSDNPTELHAQLREIEAWYARMVTMLAWSESALDLAINDRMPDRSIGTELDRKSKIDALVAPERRFRDILEGLCDSIKQRISLGQSLIKAQEREMSRIS